MERAKITVELREPGDRICQSFDGTAERTAAGVTLRYREPGENGLEGRVEIAAAADEITIERRGSVTMTQRLVRGLPTAFTYATPHGDLELRVDTKKLRVELRESRGRLYAAFTQRLGGELTEKTLEIKYVVTKDGKEL